MATTTQTDLKALDQTRQRLLQLTTALNSLRRDLEVTDPLPSWPAIQQSATFITNQLQAIHNHLAQNRALLSSIHAYPLPSFPGRAQETLLGALLRKKLEPGVEDWVREGRKIAEEAVSVSDKAGDGGGRYGDLESLWDWAVRRAVEIYEGIPAGLDYTMEEMARGTENVRTGIVRRLSDGGKSDEDDEGGDEEEEGDGEDEGDDGLERRRDVDAEKVRMQAEMRPPVMPMMPLDDILRFMVTGAMPSSRVAAAAPNLSG